MRPDFGRLRADVLSVQVSKMGRYSGIGMPRAKKKENAGGASSRSMNVVLKLRGVTAGRATDDDPRPPDAMALLLMVRMHWAAPCARRRCASTLLLQPQLQSWNLFP